MTKQVQRRRGTATQHTSFTGAEGEISVNTTNKSVHVHDGVTAGGVEAARADLSNVSDANLNSALSGNTVASLTITSADINGGTIDGTVIGGSTPAAISGTTITGTSFVTTGDMTFGDSDKAIFGAGSDLQIYHTGDHSYIDESGTGNLYLNSNGSGTIIVGGGGTQAQFFTGGAVNLFYDNAPKLSTTSTGIDVTGTVTADGLTVDGNITSTGGDLNLDTLDLNAMAASKAVTAVDVFVYDTSKDSDGGAWRKRTQGTSWYNETLNTATRGSRREFPAVAVIVAESNQVTIYDGDDPSLPMWMVFQLGAYNYYTVQRILGTTNSGTSVKSVSMLNGDLIVGVGTTAQSGVRIIKFPSDSAETNDGASPAVLITDLSDRNSDGTTKFVLSGSGVIVNGTVNDVAMTVLPDAPIDPATGLPVPTIAVATAGGISVIRDDGNVWDITNYVQAPTAVEFVDIAGTQRIITQSRYGNWSIILDIPTADISLVTAYFNRDVANDPLSGVASHYASTGDDILVGKNVGLLRVLSEPGIIGNGPSAPDLRCDMKSTYNTGWMNGDIKGAFLSDTDDTDLVGAELVTNGTFDTDTTGWSNTSATIASVSGELQVSNQTGSPSATTQTVSGLVVGKVYAVTATYSQTGTGGTAARVSFFGILSENNSTSTPVTKTIYATATQTTATLSLQSFGTSSTISHFDNVSVKLADADRSVNNKGLIVNGTVTRTAVATGADLVAYSGFSASNYLEQPYNSALDFGTGDFCVMGWAKFTNLGAFQGLFTRTNRQGSNAGTTDTFYCRLLSDGRLQFNLWNGSATTSQTFSAAVPFNTWVPFAIVRRGGVLQWFVNGVPSGTAVSDGSDVSDITDGTEAFLIGKEYFGGGGFAAGNTSFALFRISATAPTAEQIAKIYNDEKVLFQDNAQATLYGASDAVTALAHDDATNLLHVGTSAGRSVFQGLRRVENTTTAVGTAISASNSLVVEE
jgi:trimeric autotransporter adhesin